MGKRAGIKNSAIRILLGAGIKMDLMTKRDVANFLKVSLRTLDYLIASGSLPEPKHLRRRAYFIRDELETHLRERLTLQAK